MTPDEVENLMEVGWTPAAHPKLTRIDTLEHRERGRPARGRRCPKVQKGRSKDQRKSWYTSERKKVKRASATPIVVTHRGVRTDTQSEQSSEVEL